MEFGLIYLEDKKKPVKSLSFHGHVSGTRADRQHPDILNILAKNGIIVNYSLLNLPVAISKVISRIVGWYCK